MGLFFAARTGRNSLWLGVFSGLAFGLLLGAFVEWQRTVPMIHVTPEMKWAAVRYVDGLRKTVPQGHALSPRATIAWMRAAQARAMLAGREFVTIDDLHDVAGDVLRHRLWISPPEIHDRLRGLARSA